jgi:hypothetical protein
MFSLPAEPAELKALSDDHYREIVEGSGVDPGLMGDAFKTITAADALALGFSKAQARDGLLIELPAPDGEISYQLKPDNPRIGDKGKPVKYETRTRHDNRLGIPVPAFERIVHGYGDRIITEGGKKGFCALTHGIDPIIVTGVWNAVKKRKQGGVKYGRPELIPDWDDLPLDGVRYTFLFDADYKTNPSVALAMKVTSDRLTERGAKVYIATLPGPEKGLDDFVVAGGDLKQVIADARPYDPTLLTPYIVRNIPGPDETVLSALEEMDEALWTGRSGKTQHSLMRALLELALERGEIVPRSLVHGHEVGEGPLLDLSEQAKASEASGEA